jgi:hypothetical protein
MLGAAAAMITASAISTARNNEIATSNGRLIGDGRATLPRVGAANGMVRTEVISSSYRFVPDADREVWMKNTCGRRWRLTREIAFLIRRIISHVVI